MSGACAVVPSSDRLTEAEAIYVADMKGRIAARIKEVVQDDPVVRCSPGKSSIWFVVDRRGEVVGSGVEMPALAMRDRFATAAVRGASLRPMTDDLWPGNASWRFTVDITIGRDWCSPSEPEWPKSSPHPAGHPPPLVEPAPMG